MGVLFKRPFLLAYLSVILIFYCVFEYNIILPLLFSFSAIGAGNVFDSAISFIQLVLGMFTPSGAFISGILMIAACMVGTALAASLLTSGFLGVLNNSLNGTEKSKGELLSSIKKYFLKTFKVTFTAILFSVMFLLFIMVVCVPGLAVSRAAASGKLEFIFGAAVLDLLTLVVLFFACIFFRIYTFFWFPSSFHFDRQAFKMGKKITDKYFWSITGTLFRYDLVFILTQGALLAAKLFIMHQEKISPAVVYPLLTIDWLAKTLFFGSLIVYVFSAFQKYLEAERQ